MKNAGWLVLVYGILVLVGGFIGHIKAASTASLFSGLIFGSLLIISALFLFKGKFWGYYPSIACSFLLDAFFTYRLMSTQKFMPAGMMAFVSLIVIVFLVSNMKKQLRTTR